MPRFASCFLPLFLAASCAASPAMADPTSVDAPAVASLRAVLDKLSATADKDQAAQIAGAIQASPRLAATCNTLAGDGKLVAIVVYTPGKDAAKPKGPFQAWTENGTIMISAPLLLELRKSRLYDVVTPDDVLPNNTAFVLGHLAYHLQHPVAPVTAPKFAPGQAHDYTQTIQEYQANRMNAESNAFIEGWNVAVDAATSANEGRPLKGNQVVSLLMNLRYRFGFIGGLQQTENKLQIKEGGWIVPDEANVKVFGAVLAKSRVADID